MAVEYKLNQTISLDAFIELLDASTLAERRPVHNREVMQAMLDHGNVIVSAWEDDMLVGIATTLTDFYRVAYLADLAVRSELQGRGIGKELVRRTREALQPTCAIVLLAAPKANDFYPKIGFEQNPRAWVLTPSQRA